MNNMKRGKQICETLRGIRSEIARANEIEYTPRECHHEGDCAGTCPACESEMRWLEGQLSLRQSLGKAVTIAGLSLGMASLASCTACGGGGEQLQGEVPLDTTELVCDSTQMDAIDGEPELLEGDVTPPTEGMVTREPAEVDGVPQHEDPSDNRPPQP